MELKELPKFDELRLFYGMPLVVNGHITVYQPKMRHIVEMGEAEYSSVVSALTAISSDCKSLLWDIGVDWCAFEDIEMFALLTHKLTPDSTREFLGELDLSMFKLRKRENGQLFMENDAGVEIDVTIHSIIADAIRQMHGLKKRPEFPGNDMTKRFLIDEDRERRIINARKKQDSQLKLLVSRAVNSPEFKYNLEQTLDLTVYQFMDSVYSIQAVSEAANLSAGIYSGNIDVKKMSIDTKRRANRFENIK
ncbi:MAG: hypothetical protein LBD92_07295 [Oscillospiraceae bacterium]|jgi:hypothetical protein|nr:hypothetical protein [Oscillospiraceae bacterium]